MIHGKEILDDSFTVEKISEDEGREQLKEEAEHEKMMKKGEAWGQDVIPV